MNFSPKAVLSKAVPNEGNRETKRYIVPSENDHYILLNLRYSLVHTNI